MTLQTAWSRLDDGRRQNLAALPRSLAILLENILQHEEQPEPYIILFENWLNGDEQLVELPFRPSRILLQDTAGVAALADLAALRDHHVAAGGDPSAVDAVIPIDLVIDHSVRVDHSGTAEAASRNLALEFSRNGERYSFFKWARNAFPQLNVVPPGQGICHQINLEQLSQVAIAVAGKDGWIGAETLIGTDSHTTMVNALGILGWGVGGIEAEMAALGQALPIPLPQVCEVRLTGSRRAGVTATDLALHITARLRAAGVVDQIIEFTGDALDGLALPDRAAIANLCPEYGATAALFPVDEATLCYLALMGREGDCLRRVRDYAHATGLWRDTGPARRYSRSIEIALDALGPVMAGPSRPQQLHPLAEAPRSLRDAFPECTPPADRATFGDGAIAIAAITSCTNTANPDLMIAAGLLARNACAKGLSVPDWVKTSLAPGSRRIAAMLGKAGLQPHLDALGFHVVGFGCTTCVGNSGDLKPAARREHGAPALLTALLSGNRNFENRIHPAVRANYLASPALVVAGALAGNLFIDLEGEPLGIGSDNQPVYLRDIWPDPQEIAELVSLSGGGNTSEGPGDEEDAAWSSLPAASSLCFPWDGGSTFICRPSFFDEAGPGELLDIDDAHVLAVLGDNVTTDHISPIARIEPDSPAGRWLIAAGQPASGLGSYGDRRANHHVMVRGTFDNARLANALASAPGNLTLGPAGQTMPIFDAAMAFAEAGRALVVIAGENYGTGSARDWAAKGTALLGVRAVLARSFERIHRNNLIAMGVVPIEVPADQPWPVITATTSVAIRGLGSLAMDRRDVEISLSSEEGAMPVRLLGQAAVTTASQLELLKAGGIFARLRQRFG